MKWVDIWHQSNKKGGMFFVLWLEGAVHTISLWSFFSHLISKVISWTATATNKNPATLEFWFQCFIYFIYNILSLNHPASLFFFYYTDFHPMLRQSAYPANNSLFWSPKKENIRHLITYNHCGNILKAKRPPTPTIPLHKWEKVLKKKLRTTQAGLAS